VLACDLLAFTKAAKPLLGYPGPTLAAVRLVSNMCKSEAGDHAEEARHAYMSGNVPKFVVSTGDESGPPFHYSTFLDLSFCGVCFVVKIISNTPWVC